MGFGLVLLEWQAAKALLVIEGGVQESRGSARVLGGVRNSVCEPLGHG